MLYRKVLMLSSALLVGCASERSLTGPTAGVAPTQSLLHKVYVIGRCPQSTGWAYEPYYVVDGRVYEPGSEAEIAKLNPAEINEITILRGDEAARRYGATAGVVGVVVITMRDHGAQAVRRAST